MRMTIRTSLAMRSLMFCAVNTGRTVRRQEVAEATGASENHLAQVIHLLAQKNFLRTIRGRAGGLMLARPAAQITVGEVFRTFERVIPFADCFRAEGPDCPLAAGCRLNCVLAEALEAFYARLDRVTVAELVDDNTRLHGLLRVA
jgi:Rrf2 family nitric oxide-sensitive transcriptional repressor